jgi:hypothetical protein
MGQAGITDKLVALIALSASMTSCSPWGHILEAGVGVVAVVCIRVGQEGLVLPLKILPLPPRRLSNVAWV